MEVISPAKTDIKSLFPEELAQAFEQLSLPKYRAKQMFRWLSRGAAHFEEMSDLPKDLRALLSEQFEIRSAGTERSNISFDCWMGKWWNPC